MALKLRIDIAVQLNDGVLYRTRRFLPDYRYTANYLGLDCADELVVLDITRASTAESRERFWKRAEALVDEAMTPALIGGNIETMEDVDRAIRGCAEGVVIGRAAWRTPDLVSRIAERYGSQACTVAIDFLPGGEVRGRGEAGASPVSLLEAATSAARLGAGQLLLTSIDRDGSLAGYDVASLALLASQVSVPVMIAGGCGNAQHMREAFAVGANACVTSNIFHMSKSGMVAMHQQLAAAGVNVRSVEWLGA